MCNRPKTLGRSGAPAVRYQEGRTFFGLLLLAGLCIFGSGCTSIYHRARPKLPPEPRAQLEMRIEEALRADRLAFEAGEALRDHVRRGVADETLQTDLDRLETCAFELERRALTARDVASACDPQAQRADEIDRLQGRSRTWLDYVETARRSGPGAQTSRLDQLLGQ